MYTNKLTGGITPFCPVCEHQLDGFTNPHEEEHPLPGDVSVCLKCATVLQFDESLMLVKASEEIVAETKEMIDPILYAVKSGELYMRYMRGEA